MKYTFRFLVMAALGGTLAGIVATTQIAGPLVAQENARSSSVYEQLDLFGDIFERIRAQYVEKVDESKLIEAAINGMLGSLDPYSAYLNNRSYRAMRDQTQGEFGGIGLQVTKEGEFIKVISPIDGTPAAQAGMKSGDVITHADGQPLGAMTLRDSVLLLRGPTGSRVLLTVKRADMKPFDVLIVRALIHIQSVRWSLEKGIS